MKEQSRAKHTVNLRKCLVKHHAGLNQRMPKIPDQTLAPVELISMIAEDSKEVTPEDMQRAARAREFAPKLAARQESLNSLLPLIKRGARDLAAYSGLSDKRGRDA